MTLRIAHHSNNRDDSNNIKKSKFLPRREITAKNHWKSLEEKLQMIAAKSLEEKLQIIAAKSPEEVPEDRREIAAKFCWSAQITEKSPWMLEKGKQLRKRKFWIWKRKVGTSLVNALITAETFTEINCRQLLMQVFTPIQWSGDC